MEERPLSILVLEDEPEECRAIQDYVAALDDVILTGVTNDSKHAIRLITDCCPDAVILDLELHKGSGNGIQFLNDLIALSPQIFPYVLVTTNNISTVTFERLRKMGADFIMTKAQADYSAGSVIDFLRSMKGTLHSGIRKYLPIESMTTETPEQLRKRIYKRTTTEMERIGILLVFTDGGRSAAHYVNVIRYSNAVSG